MMITPNLLDACAFDGEYDANEINEILRQNDDYILALARMKVPRHIASPEVLDLEINELAQRSRIKLWRALQKRHITHVKAYIRRIVHSESMDMVRGYKPDLPLPVDEDGELYQGDVLMVSGEGMQDPLYELELKEMTAEYITQAVDVLRSFPPCQRQVMICSLKEQVDDVSTLMKAFKKFEIDIENVRWPSKKKEVIKLKASLSIAHKKLRSLSLTRSMLKASFLPSISREKLVCLR
jgi:DNA-directed RNA polymerase specialized sigma24 family protein